MILVKNIYRTSSMILIILFAHSCQKDPGYTGQTGIVNDFDGNTYPTIGIGSQIWMAENLKTIHYNDGSLIPTVTNDSLWIALESDAYCWYNNDETKNKTVYGALYNWYAINTGKLCPTGWHVSTAAEWETIIKYLGGEKKTGGKLKESGTSHWYSPNTGASNSSGFTALPGGARGVNGHFYVMRQYGYWWSSTENMTKDAWDWLVGWNFSDVGRFNDVKQQGYSVRCLKDF